jgi:putative FmdB family regulatory protein
MPIYEYQCTECENEEERTVAIADRDTQECACGYEMERRICFHGSVWAPTAGGMK